MSISFSGLASGLDTTSWVESLVALKRAKVDTLQEQKENVLLSQSTLNSIKSFFSSFRSVIERVTDTKFNIVSMDLFAQNVATSANLSVVAATADTSAEEGIYQVLVDKLATNTQATSNYSYITTIIQTTTATSDSYLKHLGVTAGNILVRVNGIDYGVNIAENDTISSFVKKLQDVGVNASFNDNTGIFNMNISRNDITDIGFTGICDALHLDGVNEGYATNNKLQVENVETFYYVATNETKLSELGVKNGTVTIRANESDYAFTINESTTLGSFISQLNSKNIVASLDETGVFTFSDAEIVDEGDTEILSALGLEVDIYSKTQSATGLKHEITVTESTTATEDTLLKDLGTGTTIYDNQTVIIKNSNNATRYVTLQSTSTVGDLLQGLRDAGLSATINSDGTVDISGGQIIGGSFDVKTAFGLTEEAYSTSATSANQLKHDVTITENATLSTRIVEDLGVKAGYFKVTSVDGNVSYQKVSSGETISDFISKMSNLGVNASLNSATGVLTIAGGTLETLTDSQVTSLISSGAIVESNTSLKVGSDLITKWFGQSIISADQTSVNSTSANSSVLQHKVTTTVAATATTQLGKLGVGTSGTAILDVRGESRTINVTSSMTVQDLVDALTAQGISSSWDDANSTLSLNNAAFSGGSSNIASALGMTNTITGRYVTSNVLTKSVTNTIDATGSTTLSEFGISDSMSVADRTVTIFGSNGNQLGTVVVRATTTLQELENSIDSFGVNAKLQNGIFSIVDGYIKNDTLEASMGLDVDIASSYVLGSVITKTVNETVTGNSKLGDIISTLGTTSAVSSGYNLTFNGTNIGVTADTTLDVMMQYIRSAGGTATLDANGYLSIGGGSVSGSVATALGITSSTSTSQVSATGNTLVTNQEKFADLNTTFSDLGIANTEYYVYNSLGNEIATVNVASTSTIEAFFAGLQSNGITGSISNGIISVSSTNGNYINGTTASALGIGTKVVTTVVSTTQNSSSKVMYSATLTATLDTEMSYIWDTSKITETTGTLIVKDKDGVTKLSTSVADDDTVQDLFDKLSAVGITGTISDGVITLYSAQGNYAEGTVIEALGLDKTLVSSVTTTIARSVTSNAVINYTTGSTAKMESTIADFLTFTQDGISNAFVVTDKYGNARYATMTITSTTTFQDMANILASNNITMKMEGGVISLESSVGNYIFGDFIGVLGLGVQTNTEIKTVATTATSSVAVTNTVSNFATGATFLTTIVGSTIGALEIRNSDGELVKTTVLANTTTFDGLKSYLGSYGITATLVDGVISIGSSTGNYISGALADSLGIDVITTSTNVIVGIANTSSAPCTITLTVGTDMTSGQAVQCWTTEVATTHAQLGDLGLSISDYTMYVNEYNGAKISTIALSATSTIGDLISRLSSCDFNVSLNDGTLIVNSTEVAENRNYLSGTLASALGLTSINDASVTLGSTYTSSQIKIYTNSVANEDTLLKDISSQNYTVTVYSASSTKIGTIKTSDYSTLGDLFDAFQDYNINASINNNGKVSISSSNGAYLSNDAFLDAFGMSLQQKETGSATSSTPVSLSYSRTVSAETSINDYFYLSDSITIYNTATNGNAYEVINISNYSNKNLSSLFSKLVDYGISMSVQDGKFTYSRTGDNYYLDKDTLSLYFGINLGSSYVYSADEDTIWNSGTIGDGATGGTVGVFTTLGSIVVSNTTYNGTSNLNFKVLNEDTNTITTIVLSSTDTVGTLINILENSGFIVDLTAGNLTIRETTRAHLIDAAALTSMFGFTGNSENYSSLDIGAQSGTSSQSIYCTHNSLITGNTTGEDLGLSVWNIANTTFDKSLTINQLSQQVASYTSGGIQISVSNGIVSVSTKSGYNTNLSGMIGSATATALNLQFDKEMVNASDGNVYQTVHTLTTSDKIGSSGNHILVQDKNGNSQTVAWSATSTVAENAASLLSNYGINLNVNNGKLVFTSTGNNFVTNVNINGVSQESIEFNTRDVYRITPSDKLISSYTVSITETSTFGSIYQNEVGSGYSITVFQNGTEYTTNVYSTTSVSSVLNWLNNHGIEASLNEGFVTVSGSSNAYIFADLEGIFGDLEMPSYTFCTSHTTEISEDLTMGVIDSAFLTATSAQTGIVIHSNDLDADRTYVVSKNKTLGEVINDLRAYGILASVSDGKLSLVADSGCYIKSYGSVVASAFKLTAGENISYKELKNRYNGSSDALSYNTTYTLSETTASLGSLGLTSDQYFYGVKDGQEWNVAVSPTTSLVAMKEALAAYGITVSVSDGKLSLVGSSSSYITSMSPGLADLFNLDTGLNKTYVHQNVNTYSNTNATESIYKNVTSSVNGATTFATLGLASNTEGYITIVSNGTEKIVTVKSTTTMSDLNAMLSTHGAALSWDNGKVTLAGNGTTFIKDISSNIKDILKVNTGLNYTYTTTVQNGYVNDSSDSFTYSRTDLTATISTQLSSINGYANGNGQIKVHKSDGTYATVTLSDSDTIESFFNKISGYGLAGTIDSNGIITILGTGNVYLEAVSGGTNVLTALNMGNVVENITTATHNTGTNSWKQTITVNATGTTELKNVKTTAGSGITFDGSGKTYLTLKTVNTIGAVNNYTLTFSNTNTINDVIDALNAKGIKATLDTSGRFSVTATTLSDFDMTGSINDVLMGSYTKEHDTNVSNNLSTRLVENKVVILSDSDTLSSLGITNGNINIRQNGVDKTVAINTSSIRTVGDFRNLLSSYGFSSYIDSEGRLAVTGVGDSSLSEIGGGSNILSKFGLTNWQFNNVVQTSTNLSADQSVTDVVTKDVKLNELKNSGGTSLGITSGKMYIYQDGTRNLVSISNTQTLESLANTFSQYGITMGINSDGSLYFDGNNNSYVTTAGIASGEATNLLSKLGIEGNWSIRQNSSSKSLSYVQEDVKAADSSVKMTELLNSSGSLIGITTGAYSVYKDGVKTTEYINADTSVNDFLATLSGYGFNATILSDGTISIKADGNTYIETANTAGANSNVVDKLFSDYSFNSTYTSNCLNTSKTTTETATHDTKLSDVKNFTFQEGYITVVKDGVTTDVYLSSEETVGSLINELALYGINASLKANGQLAINANGSNVIKEYTGPGQASNLLDLMDIEDDSDWTVLNNYNSSPVEVIDITTTDVAATRETLLSDLGVTTGEYYIYNNGVRYTALISNDETIGSLVDTLRSFGIQAALTDDGTASTLKILGSGDSYLATSNTTGEKSNVVTKLFTSSNATYEYTGDKQTSTTVTSYTSATEDTLLNYYGVTSGNISVTIDGMNSYISISADDTVGALLNKFNSLGIEATISDGDILLQSGFKDFTINTLGTSSNVLSKLGLSFSDDLGGYVASTAVCEQTTTTVETVTLSASAYVDDNTKLGSLAISNGTFTVYRNGQKATLNIESDHTFGDLKSQLTTAFSDVKVKYDNGYLTIYSDDPNVKLEAGSTTDTSNIKTVLGLNNDVDGSIKSARALYKVNANTKLTEAGNFRKGNITEGNFKIGNVTFEITANTTMQDIISQINANDDAMATAYWDSIGGKLVIQSRVTGSSLINIEAGTSNFTDVMGFTESTRKADGSIESTRMLAETQELGSNARFAINGTYYSSTSNKVDSSVTRIEGLTLDLKGVSEGQTVEVKVERNKENLADAVSEVVDAYNTLIENVDAQLKAGNPLASDSSLKLLRDQIRSIMMNTFIGGGVFKNMDAIGIGYQKASNGNISTSNLEKLNFDRDKFLEAYDLDRDALKEFLVGTETSKGVLMKMEDVIENALTVGYFTTSERSYANKLSTLDNKIERMTATVDRYKRRLESKFQAMDMLISRMQDQYSSFLGT